MTKSRLLVMAIIMTAMGVLAAACASPSPTPTTAATEAVIPAGSTEKASLSAGELGTLAAFAATSGSQQTGIWVTGFGRVSLEPDLALLTLGVEADGATVQEARSKAAEAMAAVVAALKVRGIQDKDIRTSYFNIQPQYTYREVARCPEPIPGGKTAPQGCYTDREQVLTGYKVTNQLSVKLRDLDNIGPVIDEAATAGGDYTRISGISFTVEDDSAARIQAREKAVKDALAKAQQFAQLTGVKVGKLVYITESGGMVYPRELYKGTVEAFAMPPPAPPTYISGGELEVSVSVQAVFGIE